MRGFSVAFFLREANVGGMNHGDLRSLLYYVPEFRNRVFVVAVDGVIIDSAQLTSLLLDVAVLQALNIHVVLVFGARAQIQKAAEEAGVVLSDDNGTGPTDDVSHEIALRVVSGLSQELLNRLATVDLRGAVVNALSAVRAGLVGGVDWQHTGRIVKVDLTMLRSLIEADIIPVAAPIGFDGGGHILRLNSDAVAAEIAVELGAIKLIYVAEEGLCLADGSRLAQLTVEEAQAMAKSPTAEDDPSLISKLRYAARACQKGVPRVHLIHGQGENLVLAEVFSMGGVGTMIHVDEYQNIRPMEEADVPEVVEMIQAAVDDAALLPRTGDDMQREMADYFVMEVDKNLVACVAMHKHSAEMAEIACLYVKNSCKNQGYGRKLVAWVEKRAQASGCEILFALSTQAYTYFEEKLNWKAADPSILPAERLHRRELSGRNARVLVKLLKS